MFHIYTDAKAEIRHVWGPSVHERTKKKRKQPLRMAAWHSLKATRIKKGKTEKEIYINDAVPFCCFDESVCAPKNKLCPNDGTPVGCKNKLAPVLPLAVPN
jgi:hypothetical protein